MCATSMCYIRCKPRLIRTACCMSVSHVGGNNGRSSPAPDCGITVLALHVKDNTLTCFA